MNNIKAKLVSMWFSENYTDGVSNTQRYRMLGNGWTADVISHIFKGLKKMSLVDVNIMPYIIRMKEAKIEDRSELGLSYIDFIIKLLVRYQHSLSPNAIRSLIRRAQKQWDRLVRADIIVGYDDDGDELYLDSKNFPELFLGRSLESAKSQEEYDILLNIGRNVADFMNWGEIEIVEYGEGE